MIPGNVCWHAGDCVASGGVGQVGPSADETHSQSAEDLALNPVYHKRSKHIDIKYHWVKEPANPDGSFGRPAWNMCGPASRQQTSLQMHLPELPSTRTGGGGLELSTRVPPRLPMIRRERRSK